MTQVAVRQIDARKGERSANRTRVAGIVARTPAVISSTRSVETWLTPAHVVVDRVLAMGTDAIVVNELGGVSVKVRDGETAADLSCQAVRDLDVPRHGLDFAGPQIRPE